MTTIISAPGKVLIAGGYLVLDPKYSGVVVSTSSRFFTVVQAGNGKRGAGRIRVRSPQFVEAVWNYDVTVEGDGVNVLQGETDASKNKFVYIALQYTLKLVAEIKGAEHLKNALLQGLEITIVGGNDFYSQRAKLAELGLKPLISSLNQIPPFASTGVKLTEVHKTGLGSSAALITSLVSGLLVHSGAIPASELDTVDSHGRQLAHNASQFIHCYAQGKVGSGFDVSSAVFGSQLYTRFDPGVISGIMGDGPSQAPLLPVLSPSNKAWDYKVKPFQLPPHTRIMLADVDAGSDTPSLVGKVLKWRQANGDEANAFWDRLSNSNEALSKTLLQLSELHKKDSQKYLAAVEYLHSVKFTSNPSTPGNVEDVVKTFYEAHRLTEDIRAKMREMGRLSGVPIEPPEQTELLDACIGQEGVIGGGVPGAGGYDAVWVLVIDPPNTPIGDLPLTRVENVWTSWTKLDVSPLSAAESLEKGIRLERLEDVTGLKGVLDAA